MSRLWDWITGQNWELERQKAATELSRQRTREAQDAGLDRAVREAAQKQPEAIQRGKNELRPGERIISHEIERQRQMHDHPPEKKPDVVQREATRLEYTMTPQPAPSMGGPGIKFTNSRARRPKAGPGVAKTLLDAGHAHREKNDSPPEKQPEIRRGRSLFPDYSQGRTMKPPGEKPPGGDNQQ